MRKTLYPKTSLQVIIPLAYSISAAMMLNQGFSIHHEALKRHEKRTTGLEKQPDFNMVFSSFVLFVSFVVVYFGLRHCTSYKIMLMVPWGRSASRSSIALRKTNFSDPSIRLKVYS